MKKKALALGITMALALPGMASAAIMDYGYDGGKLSSKDGPGYQPQQTIDDVQASAAVQERSRRLQDQPDAQTEKVTLAGQETVPEQKEREERGEKVASESTLPITIYGDQVTYNSESGDFKATGNVRLYQGNQKLYTTEATGNSKTGDVYLLTGGRIVNSSGGSTSVTNGKWGHYNFLDKTGTIKDISGTNGKDIYRANIGEVYPDRVELTDGGETTRCPAVKHPPCVDVKAEKVIIYPKDKIIAYNVKVYIKGVHVYSRDRWINRFGDDDQGQSLIPHIGYTKDHGTEIRYNFNVPLSDKNVATAELKYYSKIGWRPLYYDVQDERNFYVRIQDGHTEDSDNNWIRKKRDVLIGYKSHKFNDKWPLNYSAYYSHGLWKDNWKESWHTEYGVFLTHDPIYLTHEANPLSLNLGMGHKWVKESINDETKKTMLYSATLGKSFSGGWNTWLGYYYQKEHSSVFAYNDPDMAKELQWGIIKQLGPNDRLTWLLRYDEGKSQIYEYIYRWSHDFCCFRLELEYRDKKYNNDNEWSVKYDLFRW